MSKERRGQDGERSGEVHGRDERRGRGREEQHGQEERRTPEERRRGQMMELETIEVDAISPRR